MHVFPGGEVAPGFSVYLEQTQVGQKDGLHSGLLPWASRASLSGPHPPQGDPPLLMSTGDQRMTGGLKDS